MRSEGNSCTVKKYSCGSKMKQKFVIKHWFIFRIDDLLRDTDSEDEADAETKKAKSKKDSTKRGSAWLKETSTEDIVDFLDPSVSKKVLGKTLATTVHMFAYFQCGQHAKYLQQMFDKCFVSFVATKPTKERELKKGVKHDFKVAPDGRFIFNVDKDEEEETKGQLFFEHILHLV